ncbi:MAG: rhodanese-like domain-containing protein [Bacteroidales bacterium]|nr:rhodanese-like domain-containing protein [Bacteroidales bacterium]
MKTTENPIYQNFQIEGVRHISPSDAFESANNNEAVIIDVRESDAVKSENIILDNVLYHPMSVISNRLSYISKEQCIILMCSEGTNSTKLVDFLKKQGYPDVINMDGGLEQWKSLGLPTQKSMSFSSGCGCGCSSTSSKKGNNSCC